MLCRRTIYVTALVLAIVLLVTTSVTFFLVHPFSNYVVTKEGDQSADSRRPAELGKLQTYNYHPTPEPASVPEPKPEHKPKTESEPRKIHRPHANGTRPTREAPYGEYCETRPTGEKEIWNYHKKVVSYALFLPTANMSMSDWLFNGVKANVESAKLIYPDWILRVYTLNLGDDLINSLLQLSDRLEVVRCHGDTIFTRPYRTEGTKSTARMMMPRFLAVDDPTVSVMISRDVDSRFHVRELLAVNQWLTSNYHFHSMRDHPQSHAQPVLGGMWGLKRGWGHNMTELFGRVFRDYPDEDMSGKASYDQNFLEIFVWPLVKDDTLSHDVKYHRCKELGTGSCLDFPIGPPKLDAKYFVGADFKETDWSLTLNCDLKCKLH